ncbi:hypothetical protein H4S07_005193 [Coemansia furcata]|uniref:Uncharacterized protein n=1 Tax=Coemansia furcata TaxID=417177 RepID=A0ACC1L399_9FUNG|nr:hypothetical protein H4S07_005193 [Coemansia furcata]
MACGRDHSVLIAQDLKTIYVAGQDRYARRRPTSDHYVLGTWRKFQLPHVKSILPHAPEQPVTLNGRLRMPSWYDIVAATSDRDHVSATMGRDSEPDLSPSPRDNIKSPDWIASNEDEAGMNASMIKVNERIRSGINSGIPAGRIVQGGFSQDGFMTLFTGSKFEYQPGGLAVLSGYLPIRNRILKRATDASKSVPILQVQGTADKVVLLQYG